MKTIKIQSEFENSFIGYETKAVTSKGIIRIRCIMLSKKRAEAWAEEDNRNTPYYDDINGCTIYKVYINEITIVL